MPPKPITTPGMLDRVILIEQSRANNAPTSSRWHKSQHLLDEILRNQLGIII